MFCAARLEKELDEAVNGIKEEQQVRTPLDITAADSPEDLYEKFDIMTEYLCQ